MANEKKMPQCVHCHGRNWIDLGEADPTSDDCKDNKEHYHQCGGAPAGAEPEDAKQGCMRVIRATPEQMNTLDVI
jgi:hypothetical protein